MTRGGTRGSASRRRGRSRLTPASVEGDSEGDGDGDGDGVCMRQQAVYKATPIVIVKRQDCCFATVRLLSNFVGGATMVGDVTSRSRAELPEPIGPQ
jgi:hypothetical protein